MALSDEKIRGIMKRLLISRMRILCNHGLFGLLLMHIIYSLDEETATAYTDGERIAFSPDFLDDLSDSELDFVMMHEILHIVLQHCLRSDENDPELYNMAADIVVNSIIMNENGGDPRSITLSQYGESMHKAPDGKEGSIYTAEEVLEMLRSSPKSRKLMDKGNASGREGSKGGNSDETDDPYKDTSKEDNSDNGTSGDDEKNSDREEGRAKRQQAKPQSSKRSQETWDDHSRWGEKENDGILRDVWVKRFCDACKAISIRDAANSRGTLPMFAQRILDELMKPQTDWRRILSDFIQEEVNDYSFSPPDRRFDECPFFLPDFNEKDETVKDILFMIDTSGSISDKMMTAAYSEVKGALDQFNGKLRGWLGFFDAAIIEPKPFSDFDEFRAIKPAGGGGTDFQIIFEYVDQHMSEEPPASIIILTDGYAPFPKEESAKGIPVLWLINNEEVTPPWGKVARIKV